MPSACCQCPALAWHKVKMAWLNPVRLGLAQPGLSLSLFAGSTLPPCLHPRFSGFSSFLSQIRGGSLLDSLLSLSSPPSSQFCQPGYDAELRSTSFLSQVRRSSSSCCFFVNFALSPFACHLVCTRFRVQSKLWATLDFMGLSPTPKHTPNPFCRASNRT